MSKNNNDCHQQPKHLLVKIRIIQQEKKNNVQLDFENL
jgi:hypothetical protein